MISVSRQCEILWFKVLSLVEHFKTDNRIKESTAFLFEDRTLDMNANNRYYREFEINGIMKCAFGNDTRFVANIYFDNKFEELKEYFERNKETIYHPLYNCSNYKLQRSQYKIYVNHVEKQISRIPPGGTLKLIRMKIFNPKKFKKQIKEIIKLEVIPAY